MIPKIKVTQNPYSLFIAILRSELKEEVVTEYKFHSQRKFKFDIAIPKWKVAIEVEGGIYTGTVAHSSVKGILRDMEKYNLATEEGWRVLRYTPEQTKKSATLEQIKKTIGYTELAIHRIGKIENKQLPKFIDVVAIY